MIDIGRHVYVRILRTNMGVLYKFYIYIDTYNGVSFTFADLDSSSHLCSRITLV
jgi:hypothetical protein